MKVKFFKIFFNCLKLLALSYTVLTGMAFAYSVKNLPRTESIIIGLIFLFGSTIGIFLIKYFGNAIVNYKIDSEYIILTNAKQKTVKLKKDSCTKIVNKPNQFVLEFTNRKKYYIHKYYFGYKKFFNLSDFNKSNFEYAEIIDLS